MYIHTYIYIYIYIYIHVYVYIDIHIYIYMGHCLTSVPNSRRERGRKKEERERDEYFEWQSQRLKVEKAKGMRETSPLFSFNQILNLLFQNLNHDHSYYPFQLSTCSVRSWIGWREKRDIPYKIVRLLAWGDDDT